MAQDSELSAAYEGRNDVTGMGLICLNRRRTVEQNGWRNNLKLKKKRNWKHKKIVVLFSYSLMMKGSRRRKWKKEDDEQKAKYRDMYNDKLR